MASHCYNCLKGRQANTKKIWYKIGKKGRGHLLLCDNCHKNRKCEVCGILLSNERVCERCGKIHGAFYIKYPKICKKCIIL